MPNPELPIGVFDGEREGSDFNTRKADLHESIAEIRERIESVNTIARALVESTSSIRPIV